MKSVINWFEIPVADMDRAIKFYEPVMQVTLRREKMDCAELAVFPHGRTPPCCEALIAAGVSRVVAAMQDPNPQVAGRGLYRLQQEGIDVSHGLMMGDAEAINKGFLKRMRTGFPYIQLKLGASLDGRTAMANGESQWITSPQARRDVQRLRAQSHGDGRPFGYNALLNRAFSDLLRAKQYGNTTLSVIRDVINKYVSDRRKQVGSQNFIWDVKTKISRTILPKFNDFEDRFNGMGITIHG